MYSLVTRKVCRSFPCDGVDLHTPSLATGLEARRDGPRLALSRVGCHASRLALFKLWRADTRAAIEMDELLSAGYAFQVETTRFAHLAGSRIEGGPVRLLRARRRHIQDLPRRDPRHVRRAPPPPPPMRDRTPRRHVASLLHAPVAQWIERRPPEAEVRGSNPLGRVARPTPSDLQLGDQHGAKSARSEDRRSAATRHRVRARASRSHEGARSATRAHGKGNVRRCGLLDTSRVFEGADSADGAGYARVLRAPSR